MRLFATYTNERVDVTSATDIAAALRTAFSSGTTSSLRLSLQWDKRDNRLFPTGASSLRLAPRSRRPSSRPSALFGTR